MNDDIQELVDDYQKGAMPEQFIFELILDRTATRGIEEIASRVPFGFLADLDQGHGATMVPAVHAHLPRLTAPAVLSQNQR